MSTNDVLAGAALAAALGSDNACPIARLLILHAVWLSIGHICEGDKTGVRPREWMRRGVTV